MKKKYLFGKEEIVLLRKCENCAFWKRYVSGWGSCKQESFFMNGNLIYKNRKWDHVCSRWYERA